MSCDSGAGAECDGDVAEEAEASVQLSLKQQLNLAIQRSMSDEVHNDNNNNKQFLTHHMSSPKMTSNRRCGSVTRSTAERLIV